MTFWNLPILVLFSNSASVRNLGTIQITALRMSTIFPVIFQNSICPQVICDAFKLSCFVRQGNCFSTTSTKESLAVWQWSWIFFCLYYYYLLFTSVWEIIVVEYIGQQSSVYWAFVSFLSRRTGDLSSDWENESFLVSPLGKTNKAEIFVYSKLQFLAGLFIKLL